MIGMDGWQWYDNDPRKTFEARTLTALAQYQNKFKKTAQVCLVNPKDAEGQNLDAISKSCGVTVRAARQVLPGHFWAGVETEIEAQHESPQPNE